MKEVKVRIPDNCVLIKDGDTYIVRERNKSRPEVGRSSVRDTQLKRGKHI